MLGNYSNTTDVTAGLRRIIIVIDLSTMSASGS